MSLWNRFWKQSSEHCPETRVEMAKQHNKSKPKENEKEQKEPKTRKLFAECGRPYNLNEPKLTFTIEDLCDRFILDLHIYKYVWGMWPTIVALCYSHFDFRFLETSLLEVDVQPNYIRVTVKGKIFQLALSDEVNITKSSSERSTLTGHLVIVMPKLTPSNSNQITSIGNKKSEEKVKGCVKKVDREIPPLCWWYLHGVLCAGDLLLLIFLSSQ